MDGLKFSSTFMTGLISKLISRAVRKKTGNNIGISIKEVVAYTDINGKTHIHLDVDAEIQQEDLMKILKDFM